MTADTPKLAEPVPAPVGAEVVRMENTLRGAALAYARAHRREITEDDALWDVMARAALAASSPAPPAGGDAAALRDGDMSPTAHAYVPHRKFPWFCETCGYAEHERLKHPADAALAQEAQADQADQGVGKP